MLGLPAKLEFLLSLPFEVFCFSEVRVPGKSVRSLARVASGLRCSVVWSSSPPPSPPFSVAPEGCAIFVRSPLVVEELRPPALEKWRNEGRLCVARISDSGGRAVCVVSCYGYPPSHQGRRANEVFLLDALAYTGGLNYPSILLGDLNDHPTTSNALAQASIFDMHRLTCDDPTTLSKDGNLSAKLPIDHCYVNRRSLEVGVDAKIDPTLRVSDHVPVLVRVRARSPKFLVADWAKPTKDLPPRSVVVPWTAFPLDFQSWQEAARQWLEKAHAHPISPKGTVALRPYQGDPKIQKHLKFRRLLTLQRAVLECEKFGLNEAASASLARKLTALGALSWLKLIQHPKELRLQVEKSIGRIMHAHHRKLLKGWKTKVHEWHVSDAAAYRFLRNPLPSRSVANPG